MAQAKGFLAVVQRYSLPLIGGVLIGMIFANVDPQGYAAWQHARPFGDWKLLGHSVDLTFLVNDVFMAFFFGLAAKEITDACLPGGALSPPSKALNPLIACVGGVAGPIAVYFGGLALMRELSIVDDPLQLQAMTHGWGVPCATDIAIAWLLARLAFGDGHPAIDFLLLLAIVDDAIGLVVIAVFYGDPAHPTEPVWLGLVALGLIVAFCLRRLRVARWWPYVVIGGTLAWVGLFKANVHSGLALVAIVPFLPAGSRDPRTGHRAAGSALADFEHALKLPVDLGLFFFAFINVGLELAAIGPLTWLILAALALGKTIGIGLAALLARSLGFQLPARVGVRELFLLGLIAAVGLTVAVFVAGEAFVDRGLGLQAKMGALLSVFLGLGALLLARAFPARTPRDGAGPS